MQSVSNLTAACDLPAASVAARTKIAPAASVENLSKNFGATGVLKNIGFTVERGESLVLLGASGSGKTTILRIIAGLEQADAGRITLGGADVSRIPAHKRNVGVIFQNYALFPKMTVAQNIGFGLKIRGADKKRIAATTGKLIELVRLEEHRHKFPSQLSGGQQQRVAIARALAYEPKILLFDEPFNALDAKIRTNLRREIRELLKKINVAAIFITHDQDEALELADRIAVLNRGSIEQIGTPSEIYNRPQTEYVASFLGAANLLITVFERGWLKINDYRLPLKNGAAAREGQRIKIVFRPEDVILSELDEPADRHHKIAYGTTEAIYFAGATERVTVRLETDSAYKPVILAARTKKEVVRRPIKIGERVFVQITDFQILP